MFFEFRSANIFYEVKGEGENALVLLHGWGGSSKTLACVQNLFSDMRVISFDFPPFGRSSQPPESWSLADYTDAVINALTSLGVTRAFFLGHSFGGRVCIDLASRTDLAAKLVLVDSAGIKPKATLKKLVRGYRFRRDKKRGRDVTKYYSADYSALPPEMRQVFSRIVSEDLSGRLSNVRAETLIIWGRNDRDTPLYMAKKLNKGIRGSGLIVLDGGHYSFLDSFADFSVILKHFLLN